MSNNIVSIRVWGDFACFTRPEMKVERVSYPIMTPSAARGVLEAIFWEPQMYYLIDTIGVVRKGRWASFRRNEVTDVVSLDNAKTWMKTPGNFRPICAGGGAEDGTQRNVLALEGVEYIIAAEINLSKLGERGGQKVEKYVHEIERRARQGKCFHRPALGVREFAADFEFVENLQVIPLCDWLEEDLGLILYDVFDPAERGEGFRWLSPEGSAAADNDAMQFEGRIIKPQAMFFHADVRNAMMTCHPEKVKLITPKGDSNYAA